MAPPLVEYPPFPCYGDKSVAHAAMVPSTPSGYGEVEGPWIVWFKDRGCIKAFTTLEMARALLRSVGVAWTHLAGEDVTA